MDNLEILHDILIAGSDFESCRQRVSRFFEKSMLIRYDGVLVPENEAINGSAENFMTRIEDGLAANQKVLGEFLDNLKEEGFTSIDDLQRLEKGYLSKTLHTIAHLQDGFIGIDSRFYNLVEDSHGVSRSLQQILSATPGSYWILKVKGRIASESDDPFDALRTFEWKGKPRD